jgi:predicted MPP superfamily phosphohydrolase
VKAAGFLKLAAFLGGAVGAGMLVYGTLVESNRLVVERRRLRLSGWPKSLDGFRIAVLADLHLRDEYSERLGERAIAAAIAEEPNVFAIPGDVIAYWKPGALDMARRVLEPLRGRPVVLSFGNHEHECGHVPELIAMAKELGFTVLLNEAHFDGQVTWVGVDSAKMEQHEPEAAMARAHTLPAPRVVLWHEPDMVDHLPSGAALMLSGHSHGGQFRFPGGFTPMYTRLGKRYPGGFYPKAPTPLYVSRGIGTTGPPSRFNCPPEVSILTLESADQ